MRPVSANLQQLQPGRLTNSLLGHYRVVGHLARSRNQAIGLLGEVPPYADEDFAAYAPGGWGPTAALPLSLLRDRLEGLAAALAGALAAVRPDALATPAPFSPTGNPSETVGSLLAAIAFHEAYHCGQTGVLRRLLGMPGALTAPGEAGHSEAGLSEE